MDTQHMSFEVNSNKVNPAAINQIRNMAKQRGLAVNFQPKFGRLTFNVSGDQRRAMDFHKTISGIASSPVGSNQPLFSGGVKVSQAKFISDKDRGQLTNYGAGVRQVFGKPLVPTVPTAQPTSIVQPTVKEIKPQGLASSQPTQLTPGGVGQTAPGKAMPSAANTGSAPSQPAPTQNSAIPKLTPPQPPASVPTETPPERRAPLIQPKPWLPTMPATHKVESLPEMDRININQASTKSELIKKEEESGLVSQDVENKAAAKLDDITPDEALSQFGDTSGTSNLPGTTGNNQIESSEGTGQAQ